MSLATVDYDIPWERQPFDTNPSFRLFSKYLDLGPARSLHQLAKETGYKTSSLHRYQTEYKWVSRAAQYDDYVRRIELEEHFRARREMAKRHTEKAQKMLVALMAPVEALQDKLDKDPEGTMAELKDMPVQKLITQVQASARVLQPIMNAERLAQGLPTEITEGREEHVHSIDTSNVDRLSDIVGSLEETNLLAHFLGERAAGEVVDAEVVEIRPDRPTPKADGISARPPA